MTNRDRLISLLGFAPQKDSIDGALIDVGVEGSDTYDGSMAVPLKTVAVQLMELLLTTANTSDSTSGFGVTYDRNAVLARIKIYKLELGILDDSLPIISSPKWW